MWSWPFLGWNFCTLLEFDSSSNCQDANVLSWPSQLFEDLKRTAHSSPSFCNPLLLLTEAIRFMRRLAVWASGETVVVASSCCAWPAAVWGIDALPLNGVFDSPLACPRPRDCQVLPLTVPRWISSLFLLLVLDILTLSAKLWPKIICLSLRTAWLYIHDFFHLSRPKQRKRTSGLDCFKFYQ